MLGLKQVEDDSKLTSVNEIAAAVYEMVGWIQKEVQFAWIILESYVFCKVFSASCIWIIGLEYG